MASLLWIACGRGDGRKTAVTSSGGRIRGTKLTGEGGVESTATIDYAGVVPKLIVERYFENGKEAYTQKLALASCD